MISSVVMSFFLLSHATLDTIKTQFLEKNVGEAVFLLKTDHQKILTNPQQRQQVAQWLETFQYDSTLNQYEKGVDLLLDLNVAESEKSFLLALEREPYNTKLLTHTIALWLGQKSFVKAKEKILWAQKELPFLATYDVYGVWQELKETGQTKANLSCQSATLSPAEKDFCQYVVLWAMVLQSKAKKPTTEIMKAFQKTKVPNKHFILWEKWKNPDEKQKYLSSCRTLSDKQKKVFLIVPEFCVNEDKETND